MTYKHVYSFLIHVKLGAGSPIVYKRSVVFITHDRGNTRKKADELDVQILSGLMEKYSSVDQIEFEIEPISLEVVESKS